ncbi:hypothetical protein EYF80_051241 [Liparis tanakae]|uniref:Uncharacterized protein n=1 Tax=Liparis tanakae TaxID=230148 RepID=A0A4Z2FBN4_9TELE|nr:hypothetical protein EYF80_051241 [Liparis tanakae]
MRRRTSHVLANQLQTGRHMRQLSPPRGGASRPVEEPLDVYGSRRRSGPQDDGQLRRVKTSCQCDANQSDGVVGSSSQEPAGP